MDRLLNKKGNLESSSSNWFSQSHINKGFSYIKKIIMLQ